MALDHLRPLVDLPLLIRLLDEEAITNADQGAVLQWYAHADCVVGREVAAGRATAVDAKALQQEAFGLMAAVPGLQFVTNEPFGLPNPS